MLASHFAVKGNMPSWFVLSWDNRRLVLRLSIDTDVFNSGHKLHSLDGGVKYYQDHVFAGYWGMSLFHSFVPLSEPQCGFAGCMRRLGDEGRMVRFELPLPRIKWQEGECQECKSNDSSAFSCYECNDTKKRYRVDWDPIHVWSATLAVMIRAYGYLPPETLPPSNQSQLALLWLGHVPERGLWGAPITVAFSPVMVGWIETQGKELAIETTKVMNKVYRHLWKGHVPPACSMPFSPTTHQLVLVSGGASIGTAGDGPYRGLREVMELSAHNTDSVRDQTVLLIGAVHLMTRASEALYG